MKDITQEELKEVLYYDRDNGNFYWIKKINNKTQLGAIAGADKEGYRRISINYKTYRSHRLAFLYIIGRFPLNEVDHINRKKSDNRWVNLREVTHSQNQRNSSIKTKHTTGFKGVAKSGNRYMARIHNKHLGSFKTAKEAHEAYKRSSLLLHKEYSIYY